MKKFDIILLLIVAAFPQKVLAQALSPVVEVSSQYSVDLGEIHKPTMNLTLTDSLRKFDINFDYSIYDRPYQDLYEFAPYAYTKIKSPELQRNNIFYANLGYQSILSPTANLSVQAVTKKNFSVGVYGNYDGYYQPEEDIAATYGFNSRYKTDFGANAKYAWGTGEAQVDANYRIFDDKYDFLNQRSDKMTLSAVINSAHKNANSIDYDFITSLHHLNVKNSAASSSETMLEIDGIVGTTFDIHRIYVDVDVQMAAYSGTRGHEAWILEFAPMYEYSKGRLFGHFGAKFGSRFGSKVKDPEASPDHRNNLTNIFPSIDAKFSVWDKHLWLHAIATGSNHMNSLESIVSENPIVNPLSELKFGNTPIDASLRIETSFWGKLSFNLMGGYSITKDMMIAGADAGSSSVQWPVATYWDVQTLYAGTDALLKMNHFSIGGDFTYGSYSDWYEETPLDVLPRYKANAFVNYDLRNRLFVSARLHYRSQTRFMPDLFDLGLNVSLSLNKHFSIYFKAANLLDCDLFYTPQYQEQGRNFGGGLTVNF